MYRALCRLCLLVLMVPACRPPADPNDAMNEIAEAYVKLVLAVGQHDDAYVDAYYGPAAWREEAEAAVRPLDALAAEAEALQARLGAVDVEGADEMLRLRHRYLTTQLRAVAARVDMLRGRTFTFDEEAKALYDAAPPTYPESHFQAILDELDGLLPGDGPLTERYARFRAAFIIPPERLDTVFTTAIAEARRRTKAHIALPPQERFVLEYVTDKPWSGYNWYQGDAHSLIQINTDLPIYIDRAIDLAAHEGYPGHHVYNALLEQHLVRERGWMEFSVYPLFSPQSLIAEGSANYGIDVAFPGEERLAFERDVLYPLAGLDPSRAADYAAVQERVARLSYAGNEAARRYLNGEIDADAAARFLTTYALMTPERARQRVRFIDTYRSYVINYNLGQDLVRAYVEARAGGDPDRRWAVFAELLSSPRLPSDLTAPEG
ncbi:hypothetical protein GQ464_007675 [Rhodocaloribacter litoris]|uniref:hypothetical protein n=1 Tax=Rhodocaloribacter litoris TaxID=2558931 RepID=UPI00141F118A|nr:hypothetical protein [Rhodocaloribacter litoris]QXD16806.1 hypothetical protein GQ464_007675 [Rhodocaloribacter litoris]